MALGLFMLFFGVIALLLLRLGGLAIGVACSGVNLLRLAFKFDKFANRLWIKFKQVGF